MNRLLKKIIDAFFPPPEVVHSPIFGKMILIDVGKKVSHWECQSTHPISGKVIEFFIDVENSNMPSEKQEEFLKEIFLDIEEYTEISSSYIIRNLKSMPTLNRFLSSGGNEVFEITSISIPIDKKLPTWSIDFISLNENLRRFLFEIKFKDDSPFEFSFDS